MFKAIFHYKPCTLWSISLNVVQLVAHHPQDSIHLVRLPQAPQARLCLWKQHHLLLFLTNFLRTLMLPSSDTKEKSHLYIFLYSLYKPSQDFFYGTMTLSCNTPDRYNFVGSILNPFCWLVESLLIMVLTEIDGGNTIVLCADITKHVHEIWNYFLPVIFYYSEITDRYICLGQSPWHLLSELRKKKCKRHILCHNFLTQDKYKSCVQRYTSSALNLSGA